MTTETTERWDATWSDTGEHPAVNVTSAAPDHVMELEQTHALAIRNAELSEQVRGLTDLVGRLTEDKRAAHIDLENAQTELEALRAELHPLDERRTGWTPGPKAMPRKHWTEINGVADLTEQQQHAALVAPTLTELRDGDGEHHLGATIAAELMTGVDHPSGWPTWLGDVHRTDATLTQQIAGLRSWADSYKQRPVEHTIAEHVQISDEYAEKRLAAELQYRGLTSAPSVYEQLGPDQIAIDGPPDDRVQRMIDEPERYFAEARERAERQVQAESGADLEDGPPADRSGLDKLKERVPTALTTGEQPALEPEPERKPWWRREWVAAAGIGVLWAAAMVALVVLA